MEVVEDGGRVKVGARERGGRGQEEGEPTAAAATAAAEVGSGEAEPRQSLDCRLPLLAQGDTNIQG